MKENLVERPEVKEIFISAKEHKKDKKKEEKKELKKDTKIVSYEMFCQGMSIEEIAKARDLVTGILQDIWNSMFVRVRLRWNRW